MRVLVVFSSFFLGASLADSFLNNAIPDVDFDNEDCVGDACFLRNQVMNIDRTKTDPKTGLTYNERSLGYVNTQNLLAVCLPGVAKESAADSFTSCTGKPMEDICVFAKRKWLVKDAQEETVANLDLLRAAFSGLEGGDEAVNKCVKIKEEATDDYEYEYYDYSDYYSDYDYLEEAGGIEVRRKREAGKGDKKGSKKGKKDKKKGNKDRKNKAGKGKNSGENGRRGGGGVDVRPKRNKKGKAGVRNGKNKNKKGNKDKKEKKKGKNGTRKGKKNNKKGKEERNGKKKGKKGNGKEDKESNERKVAKPNSENKKPSKEKETKTIGIMSKLGFSKMPKKSTINELQCLWDELEDLLVKCGEKIISNSP